MSLTKTKVPFLFKTQLSLMLMTGIKASNLLQLRDQLKDVPESSVYTHTHHFLRQHQFLIPEPPNDFAYWVTSILQEERVGERLMAIDTVRFRSLAALRAEILSVLDSVIDNQPHFREAPKGQEFHFMKVILFCLPTAHKAHDLKEFIYGLKKVSVNSLYYHIFDSRLRKGAMNDFSEWLEKNLGEEELAKKIDKLDPYVHTMEDLRQRIIYLLENKQPGKIHAST